MKRILRTPDERFNNLPGYSFEPHYVQVGDTRIHHIDEGNENDSVVLCLHGEPSWAYLYRKMIPIMADEHRVIAPDLVGFGRSDKYSKQSDYSYRLHLDKLQGFIDALELKNITLVCQDWGGLLGLPLAMQNQDRFERLVIMNTGLPSTLVDDQMLKSPTGLMSAIPFFTWRMFSKFSPYFNIGKIISMGSFPVNQLSAEVVKAYNAPFPTKEYLAGARIFPSLVPILPNAPERYISEQAMAELCKFEKPVLIMFSDKDPITAPMRDIFYNNVPGAKLVTPIDIKDGGHFLQEDKGEELAYNILKFLKAYTKAKT